MNTFGKIFTTFILLALIAANMFQFYYFFNRINASESRSEVTRLQLTVLEQKITDLTKTNSDLSQRLDELGGQVSRLKAAAPTQ